MKRVSNLINKIRGKRDSLHLVVEAGNKEAVEVLLNKGADVNMIDRGGKALLHYAARSGRKEIVEVLLNNGADVDMVAVDVIDITTPLHLAAKFGHKEVAEVLLNNRADVNIIDEIGGTPLHYAARFGHEGVAEVLLNNRADVDIIDEAGKTPLHYAARFGHEGVVEVLLNNRADINIIDKAGKTPLHYTTGFGREKMAGVLLSNINIMDQNRQTPLHIITSLGDMCSSNNILFLRGVYNNPGRFQGLTEARAESLSRFPEESAVLLNAGFDFTPYISKEVERDGYGYLLLGLSSEENRIQKNASELMYLNMKCIIACGVIFGSYEIRKNLEREFKEENIYLKDILDFGDAFEKKFRLILLERARVAILKFPWLRREGDQPGYFIREKGGPFALKIAKYLDTEGMRSLIRAALTGGGVVEEALKDIKDSREKIIVKLKRPVEQNMAALHTGEYTPPYSGEAVSFSRDESYEEGAVALPSYFDQMNIGASGSASQVDNQHSSLSHYQSYQVGVATSSDRGELYGEGAMALPYYDQMSMETSEFASQVDNQPGSRMSDVNTENFRVGRGSSVGWRPF